MVRMGNLDIFESSNISESGEAMPTKIDVHACDINPYKQWGRNRGGRGGFSPPKLKIGGA